MKTPIVLILIFIAAILITASLIPQEPPLKAEVVVLRQDMKSLESRVTGWETWRIRNAEAISVLNSRQEGRGE